MDYLRKTLSWQLLQLLSEAIYYDIAFGSSYNKQGNKIELKYDVYHANLLALVSKY